MKCQWQPLMKKAPLRMNREMYMHTCKYLSIHLVSRGRPTLNLPCISPQNLVTCNGEYRRPVIKAQPSFHDVEVDGRYVEYFDKWCNLFYAQTYRPTRTHTPFAVRQDPLKKMACVMSIYFETGRSANSK